MHAHMHTHTHTHTHTCTHTHTHAYTETRIYHAHSPKTKQIAVIYKEPMHACMSARDSHTHNVYTGAQSRIAELCST